MRWEEASSEGTEGERVHSCQSIILPSHLIPHSHSASVRFGFLVPPSPHSRRNGVGMEWDETSERRWLTQERGRNRKWTSERHVSLLLGCCLSFGSFVTCRSVRFFFHPLFIPGSLRFTGHYETNGMRSVATNGKRRVWTVERAGSRMEGDRRLLPSVCRVFRSWFVSLRTLRLVGPHLTHFTCHYIRFSSYNRVTP